MTVKTTKRKRKPQPRCANCGHFMSKKQVEKNRKKLLKWLTPTSAEIQAWRDKMRNRQWIKRERRWN